MGVVGRQGTARNNLARWTIDRAFGLRSSVSHEYNKNLATVDALNPEKERLP